MKKKELVQLCFWHYMAIRSNVVAKKTTEIVFLWPNMSQISIKVLIMLEFFLFLLCCSRNRKKQQQYRLPISCSWSNKNRLFRHHCFLFYEHLSSRQGFLWHGGGLDMWWNLYTFYSGDICVFLIAFFCGSVDYFDFGIVKNPLRFGDKDLLFIF